MKNRQFFPIFFLLIFFVKIVSMPPENRFFADKSAEKFDFLFIGFKRRRNHFFWVSNCSSKEKEKKKSRFGTLIFVSMEYLYGTYMYGTYMYGLLVWICLLGNPPNSLFAYVWVRRTLSLYKSDFLLVLVQFCG